MSDAATVRPHLERWFESHRVVFWHDPDGQYAADLDGLDLPGVQTIRVANDEYGIKNRLLHDEPTSKFLVYRSGQVPTGIGNWLLDLELAYGVFTADRTALVAQDLGLTGEGIDEVVQAHEKFFNATKRVQSLKALLNPEDDAAKLRAKITAVVLGQREHSLLEITRTLLAENAKGLAREVRRARRLRARRLLLAGRRQHLRLRVSVAEHRRSRALDLPQGDRRLQVRPAGRPAEHPARLREPAQRPAQPGRARHARQARGSRPRLRLDDRGRELP